MAITRESMPRLAEIVDEAKQRVQEARCADSPELRKDKLTMAKAAIDELKDLLKEGT